MKAAYAKTKEKAEQGYYAEESSATEYAADKVSHASERMTEEGVHQFNKQGQKSVKFTQENIVKTTDQIADFRQKRAAKAAEQKKTQAAAERNGLQIRHGTASRSPAPAVSQMSLIHICWSVLFAPWPTTDELSYPAKHIRHGYFLSCSPVSYTHLDVYKRQVKIPCWMAFSRC